MYRNKLNIGVIQFSDSQTWGPRSPWLRQSPESCSASEWPELNKLVDADQH